MLSVGIWKTVVEMVGFLSAVVKANSTCDVESPEFAFHSNHRWEIRVKCLHGSL